MTLEDRILKMESLQVLNSSKLLPGEENMCKIILEGNIDKGCMGTLLAEKLVDKGIGVCSPPWIDRRTKGWIFT